MKKIVNLFVPTIIFIFILSILVLIESKTMEYILEYLNLEDTSKVNIFNTYFTFAVGAIMIYRTYLFARDINVRIFRILAFILNIALISLATYFVMSTGMIYFK